MKKLFLLCLVIIAISVIFAETSEILKMKQNFSGDYVFYYLHNTDHFVSQVVYNSGVKSALALGVGPNLNFKYKNLDISMFLYIDMIPNLKDPDFSIKEWQSEIYAILNYNKWNLYIKTVPFIETVNPENIHFLGRDYLGYKVGSYNLRAISEWKKIEDKLIINIGPGIEYKFQNHSLSLYVGTDLKHPHPKTGWLEVRVKL